MERIFLIGGSGFIGKNLVDFLSDNYEIHIIDKYIDNVFFQKYPQVKTLQLDLINQQIPNNYFVPDYVINLASIVTADRDMSLFDELISSNLKVLLNLYNRYKDENRLRLFIQFGSSEEYGNEGSPFIENQRETPNSPYAIVKQMTVNTALMLHQNYHFPVSVVRPGNLFGCYQNTTKFLPYVITQLKKNESISVTLCEQKRDFIYAEDFAWCISKLIENYSQCIGEIINVSSGSSIALKELIEFCKKEIDSKSIINYGAIPYRANEVMDLKCSIDKLSSIINQKIEFNIENRLKEYINKL